MVMRRSCCLGGATYWPGLIRCSLSTCTSVGVQCTDAQSRYNHTDTTEHKVMFLHEFGRVRTFKVPFCEQDAQGYLLLIDPTYR